MHPDNQNRISKIFLAIILAVSVGCGKIPADPGKTSEKAVVSGLAVGYSVNPPWITEDSNSMGGPEGYIVKKFAAEKNMNIIWHKGSEQQLLKKLENKELHIVISGISKDTPWKKKKIGLTMPYYDSGKDKRVIAVLQGENRLVMDLESFFYRNRDSIISFVNAY